MKTLEHKLKHLDKVKEHLEQAAILVSYAAKELMEAREKSLGVHGNPYKYISSSLANEVSVSETEAKILRKQND